MKKTTAIVALLGLVIQVAAAITMSNPWSYEPFDYNNSKSKDCNGWDNITQVYAYAPATVYYKGMFHQFYCSTGSNTDNYYDLAGKTGFNGAKDHIRYRTSRNGVDWSAPRIVMTSKVGDQDSTEGGACDPSVVYDPNDGYWYMLYDGGQDKRFGTVVFLARAKNIQGPYYRYTIENKWEDEDSHFPPKIMLKKRLAEDTTLKSFGVGQQSVVLMNPGQSNQSYHVWYVDNTCNYGIHPVFDACYMKIRRQVVGKLQDLSYAVGHDVKLPRDSGKGYVTKFYPYPILSDVRYNSARNMFEMWSLMTTVPSNAPTSFLKYESKNGKEWNLTNIEFPKQYYNIHNLGVSGDKYGWIYDNKYMLSFGGAEKTITDSSDAVWEKVWSEKDHAVAYGVWPMWNVFVSEGDGRPILKEKNLHIQSPISFANKITSSNIEPVVGDFDGDGLDDFGFVNMNNGVWYIYYSSKGSIESYSGLKNMWSTNSRPVVGDFDGDGVDDRGAYTFYFDSDKGSYAAWCIISKQGTQAGVVDESGNAIIPMEFEWLGQDPNATVVVGDYDGDGKDDRVLVSEKNGSWFMLHSNGVVNFMVSQHTKETLYGWTWPGMNAAFHPIAGDYDGDGITDRAIYSDDGRWFILASQTDLPLVTRTDTVGNRNTKDSMSYDTWGYKMHNQNESSVAVSGDYDGDGITDVAYVQPSKGKWYFRKSSTGKLESVSFKDLKNAQDPRIVSGDFDGDYKTDFAFADLANKRFYFKFSRSGYLGSINTTIRYVNHRANGTFAKRIERDEKKVDDWADTFVLPHNNIEISNLGRNVVISGMDVGCDIEVINVLGHVVHRSKSVGQSASVILPNGGRFIVRVGNKSRMITIK